MHNGNNKASLDSIADDLRWQNAAIEVLLRHVAHLEATVAGLTLQLLDGEKLLTAKAMKDHQQPARRAPQSLSLGSLGVFAHSNA